MTRVPVSPEMLRWARKRAGRAQEDLADKFTMLPLWEDGELQPTVKQVEAFARAVHVPVGYLFLDEPPDEALPIPDFRTVGGRALTHPSPDLLDTIYACQERQSWYRDFARVTGQPQLEFVASARLATAPQAVAELMREVLGFGLEARRACRTWDEALRMFMQRADEAGILVMVSGVVGSNNNRRLDPNEFRGFALADPLAPLVFVNGADTKAAQMFTLAHELAHIWLGDSGLSNVATVTGPGSKREEVWCNKVAAELLVPMTSLRAELRSGELLADALPRLARTFKVSTLVVLRRLLDAGWLDRAEFDIEWPRESERLRTLAQRGSGGGNFHLTTLARAGRRFTRAVAESTLEGHTLYRDAFRMLGVSGTRTFNSLSREAGVKV